MATTLTTLKAKLETIENQQRKNWATQDAAVKALFVDYIIDDLEIMVLDIEAFRAAVLDTPTDVKPNYNIYVNTDFEAIKLRLR